MARASRTVRPRRSGHDICDHGTAVAFVDGGSDAVDYNDPATAMEMEEREREQRPAPARGDVASMLMGYLFGDGPHPEHVTFRLYRLVQVCAPELLATLDLGERIVLTAPDEEARSQRLAYLIRGTRIQGRKPERHHAVIRSTLAAAWSKQSRLVMTREIPEAALTDYGAGPESRELLREFELRIDTVRALLNFFFLDGPQPERTVRRVFMVAKAYYEHLVLRMSLDQLARMFGQVRATWSWRGKAKLNAFLVRRGATAVKAPYQKSAEVCVKYAAAAQGNLNRATGRRCA